MNNKKTGNDFEKRCAEMFRKNGYWVTYMTPKEHVGSQPCDLIAIKDNVQVLVDCKTCKNSIFPISRIEQNQRLAYKRYKECGNSNYYLAIEYSKHIYFINLDNIDFNKKHIDLKMEMYI